MRYLILFVILFFQTQIVTSQSIDKKVGYYSFYDTIIGIQNTLLYNGNRYYNSDVGTTNNHKFLNQNNFSSGHVFYNKAPYYNIPLKYDLLNNVLVCKLESDQSFLEIALIHDQIDSFVINNQKFVNVKDIKTENPIEFRFLEEVGKNKDVVFYIDHHKAVKERIKKDNIVKLYTQANTYLISKNTQIYKVKSQSSIYKLFPSQKEKVKEFYKAYKLLRKENELQFMTNLFLYLTNSLKSI